MGGAERERPVIDAAKAENLLGEELEHVLIFRPDGAIVQVQREDLLAIDMGGLAIAYKDVNDKIHRVMGLPLEGVFHKTRILRSTL